MAGPLAKKVSSRELRRVLKDTGSHLKEFTSAAASDMTQFNDQMRVTRELMADHSQRIEAQDREITRTQGVVALFIGQGWKGRLKWLLTGK